MDALDKQSAAEMWAAYVAENREHADEEEPPLERFGDSAELVDEQFELVFERFDVVWPPAFAD